MTPALMALVLALFGGTPVTVPMVEAAGAIEALRAVDSWFSAGGTYNDDTSEEELTVSRALAVFTGEGGGL